jgi:hypothetical protein
VPTLATADKATVFKRTVEYVQFLRSSITKESLAELDRVFARQYDGTPHTSTHSVALGGGGGGGGAGGGGGGAAPLPGGLLPAPQFNNGVGGAGVGAPSAFGSVFGSEVKSEPAGAMPL